MPSRLLRPCEPLCCAATQPLFNISLSRCTPSWPTTTPTPGEAPGLLPLVLVGLLLLLLLLPLVQLLTTSQFVRSESGALCPSLLPTLLTPQGQGLLLDRRPAHHALRT